MLEQLLVGLHRADKITNLWSHYRRHIGGRLMSVKIKTYKILKPKTGVLENKEALPICISE